MSRNLSTSPEITPAGIQPDFPSDLGSPRAEGTLYGVIGGIEPFLQAGDLFAAAVRRNSQLPRHLTGQELQWLQVRLVQLLLASAAGPLEYAGPRLHELYGQHQIPSALHGHMDVLVMQALYEANISRVFVQVMLRIARDGTDELD
ncbi:MAG: hypothetical protein ABI383_06830 [Acidobacteriaceae bacterium]